MKRVAPLALGISLAVLTAVGASDGEDARRVFEARCETSCHRLERPLKKNKDRAGWQKTVGRMKGYAAGAITEEDAALIVEYLSRVRGPRP